MKLFLISQDEMFGEGYYESAVICTESDEEARKTIPGDGKWEDAWTGWCSSPDKVRVEYLGEAKEGLGKGTLITSVCSY